MTQPASQALVSPLSLLLAISLASGCVTQAGTGDGAPSSSPSWHTEASGTLMDLLGVWGSGPGDVYAVGAFGTLLHSAGDSTWSVEPSGTSSDLWDAGGTSANDVYLVGGNSASYTTGGIALHGDGGGAWNAIPLESGGLSLLGVWASPSDVYFVGIQSLILHSHDGSGFAIEPECELSDVLTRVWASGPTDVYAIGSGGSILHSAGNGLWLIEGSLATGLWGLWGTGPTDVWAAGLGGQMVHSRGDGTWLLQTASLAGDLHAVWSSAPGDLWAGGMAGDDSSALLLHRGSDGIFDPTPAAGSYINAIWGSGSDDVYAAGQNGTLLHYY